MTSAINPRLISCVGVDVEDMTLLQHFVNHYASLGVSPERMHIVLNTADPDSANLRKAVSILADAGATPAECWIEPYTSGGMWEKRREIQKKVAAPDDWVLNADVDEFHEYPADLREFLAWCGAKGVSVVQGPFIDRLASDLSLAQVHGETPPHEQFPVEADVACSVGGVGQHHNMSGTVKIMAHRGAILPSIGGHHPLGGQPATYLYGWSLGGFSKIGDPAFQFILPTRVHHYKWTATMLDGLRRRVKIDGVSPADKEYSEKLIAYFETNHGVRPDDAPQRRPGLFDALPWRLRLSLIRKGAALGGRLKALTRRAAL